MILRHLRYFATVAEEGSVASAARRLGVAQPALSRQIQSLERIVGFPLLLRERRGVQLSPAGEILLSGARELMAAIELSLQRARRSAEGQLGDVRIGLARSPLHDRRIGQALHALRAEYPEIAYTVTEIPSYRQPEALLADEVDVAVGMGATRGSETHDDEKGLRSELLHELSLNTVLLPVTHRLADRAELAPSDLRGELLITIDPGVATMFEAMFSELRRHDLLAHVETHRQIETIWNLVAAGRGWSIAASTFIERPPSGTVAIPLRGFDARMNVVARWRAADRSRLTSNVVTVIMRAFGGDIARRGRRATPASGMPVARTSLDIGRDVEMRQIRALLAAVDEGSLAEAAKRLRRTQSAISRQIRSLERTVGVPLLVREANGVSATAAGAIVADDAHRATTRFEQVLLQARRADRGFAGVCHVGSVPTEMSQDVLLATLRSLAQRTPAIAVEVQEMVSPRQVAALRNGEIDIGLALSSAGLVTDRSIASMRVVEDPMDCALLPATHPLASRVWLTPNELEVLPFLFIGRHVYPAFYDAVLQALENIGARPAIDESHDGPRALWSLVADGYGWTVGPRSVRTRPITGIVAVPVQGLHLPGGLDLLWRRNESNATVLTVLESFRGGRG